MKHKQTAVLLAILIGGFSQLLGLSSNAQMVTTVQESALEDNDFQALYPNADEGLSSDLTIGGPADIWTAVEFEPLTLPAGAVVTSFSIVFDIQENLPNVSFSLNIWALNGPWNESSTRNSISTYSHLALGSVTAKVGTLASDGDNSITFSGANLTAQYTDGQLANGIFWQDNDLASIFPNGATAYSNDTSLGEIGYVTYIIPEPSTWAAMAVGAVLLFVVLRRHRGFNQV